MTAALVALSTTSTAVELIPRMDDYCEGTLACEEKLSAERLQYAINDFVRVTAPKAKQF